VHVCFNWDDVLHEGPGVGPSREKMTGKVYGRSRAWTFAQGDARSGPGMTGKEIPDQVGIGAKSGW